MVAIGPLPPHAQFRDFLDEDDRLSLLDWVISRESSFEPANVFYGAGGRQSRVDPSFRQALRLLDLGPFEGMLRERLNDRSNEIMEAVGDTGVPPQSIEFELNAYGDAAHFKPHIDIPVGPNRRSIGSDEGKDRVISAVYYFHSDPRRFTGGALRVYRFGVAPAEATHEGDSVAFEPLQNSLVVFPSWALHCVERVICPSGDFRDFRFGLNCWFCR